MFLFCRRKNTQPGARVCTKRSQSGDTPSCRRPSWRGGQSPQRAGLLQLDEDASLMPGARSGRRMLPSGLCLGRWRLLRTIRARGRGGPRELPSTPQVLCMKLYGNPKYHQALHYGTVEPQDEITVTYKHGLPLVTLTLPSRKERCQFVVKPMLSTVGSFLQDLQNEDKGIKTAAIITADGSEIPASTLMDTLLMTDFKLIINKLRYDIRCHKKEEPSGEHMTELENTKSLVHRLFTILHLEEIQKRRERHLMAKIDHLQEQLRPLEQVKAAIEARSEANTSGLLWAGLALLSVQGGALAWLTWWVYSWDIMEPVTFFLSFANSIVFFAYFIITRQNYTYSSLRSRQFLQFFHKKSQRRCFDVEQYNKLKEDLAEATESLESVRRSLRLRIQGEEASEKN